MTRQQRINRAGEEAAKQRGPGNKRNNAKRQKNAQTARNKAAYRANNPNPNPSGSKPIPRSGSGSGAGASDYGTSGYGTSGYGTTASGAPGYGTTASGAPVSGASGYGTPGYSDSGYGASGSYPSGATGNPNITQAIQSIAENLRGIRAETCDIGGKRSFTLRKRKTRRRKTRGRR